MDSGLPQTLQQAVDQGIDAYVTSRRAKIPGFIDRHFSVRGALALHRELQWLLYTELLELPYAQEGRASHRDALLEHILAEPRIAALCDEYLLTLHSVADRPAF